MPVDGFQPKTPYPNGRVIMMPYPYVSVIIPVLNAEKHIDVCLNALKEQTYPEDSYEIIAVDNGSSDNSFQKLSNRGINVGLIRKKGRSRALNKALEMARGDIICSTDISCIADPDWIRSIVKSFENPEVGCVAGEIRLIKYPKNRVIEFQDRVNYMSPMYAAERVSLPFLPYADGANASFRRSVFEKLGFFDEAFFKAADVEICYRILMLSDYKIVFDKNAVVWEYGEPSLFSLLKQRYRIGLGQILIEKKYNALFHKKKLSLRKFYWAGAELLAGISRIEGIKSHMLYDKLVFLLMRLWQKIGNTYGRINLKNYRIENFNPEHVKRFADEFDREKVKKRIMVKA
ncbi:MAG: glycosyltransferase [Desulfobacterales bacterium]|jgi:cellulose synthase/poly-beta-1,6-N-acetylglucosamine synthase-like glycosyltransferase|nr:glycosyltransferase [Desulfobacterales bacterium]